MSSLTVGNNISWANQQWVVSHVTSTEAYLTLKGLSGNSSRKDLQSACTSFADKFTEAQKACLKSVTADNTSGIVFVATKDQMNGGFRYFNSDSRRALNEEYWTSTGSKSSGGIAYCVLSNGEVFSDSYGLSYPPLGFRPSVCIDLTLYNT